MAQEPARVEDPVAGGMNAPTSTPGPTRAMLPGVSPCPLCGARAAVLYDALRDALGGTPGQWRLARCGRRACGLAFLDPAPDERESGAAYQRYYTHDETTVEAAPVESHGPTRNALHRLNLWLLRVTGTTAEKERSRLLYLGDVSAGRLLEVGCGSGWRLAEFRSRGWDVVGQELDAVAAARARELHGLTVLTGPLEGLDLQGGSFDAVVMNHVIEHARQPLSLLAECWRLVKPGGRFVCVTQNLASLSHRIFGRRWSGLDTPRHFVVFTPRALRAAAARTAIEGARFRTSVGNAFAFARLSLGERRDHAHGIAERSAFRARILAASYQHLATLAHAIFPLSGDECVLLAAKG